MAKPPHGHKILATKSLWEECIEAACLETAITQGSEAERYARMCREGDPFPLIGFQWPSLLVTDPQEQKFFKGTPGDPLDPCLRLDDWQREEVLRAIFDESVYEVAIKGNTKPGKGASTSIAINVWFEVYNPCRIILTSASFAHAKSVIFAEVVKWRAIMKSPTRARVLAKGIFDTREHYIEVSNPKTGEGFSGQHGPSTLFVFDEATSLPGRFHEDAQKQARKIVAIGNPRTLSGWFYNLFRDLKEPNRTQRMRIAMGYRQAVTIGGEKCMNVRHRRLERPVAPSGGIEIAGKFFDAGERIPPALYAKVKTLIPNQVDYARFLAIKQHPDPRHVAVFAHGHFPSEDAEKQVILSSWIPRHVQAWNPDLIEVEAFGLDVARSLGGDQTILTSGGRSGIKQQIGVNYDSVPAVAQWVIEIIKQRYGINLKQGTHPICVDMIYAPGVGDLLREQGVWVLEFRGNDASTVDPKTWINLRAESYATLGRRLNPDDRWGHEPFMLPDDGELHEDLCAPEKVHPGGDRFKYRLTPKDVIKANLGRSPDKGDSAVYFFHALRLLLNWNDSYMIWGQRRLVFEPSEEEVNELRSIYLEDDYDPFTGKRRDWANGLTFKRPADEHEDQR